MPDEKSSTPTPQKEPVVYVCQAPVYLEFAGRGRFIRPNTPFSVPPGYDKRPGRNWTVFNPNDPQPTPGELLLPGSVRVKPR